jgi:hypothetical protein
MRHKVTLALIFALIALVLPTAFVNRSAARTGPVVGVSCECIANGRQACQAEASGGTAPYTYQWGTPPLTGSGPFKIVPCSGSGTRPISVTVTDANGATFTYNDQLQCCGSGDLQ